MHFFRELLALPENRHAFVEAAIVVNPEAIRVVDENHNQSVSVLEIVRPVLKKC